VVPGECRVASVAFSPDGKVRAAACRTWIDLWDVASGKEQRSLFGHEGGVEYRASGRDGKTLISGERHTPIKVWGVKE